MAGMSAAALLARLDATGVVLRFDGDTLDVDAPAGVLSEADLAAIAAEKRVLFELLMAPRQSAGPCVDCGVPLPPYRRYRCHNCLAVVCAALDGDHS